MHKIKVKALSVNQAWQGKRFKTPKYHSYQINVINRLPNNIDIPDGPLHLHIEFGYSNSLADFDNGVKPFVDILQRKYGFNDRDIKSCFISVNNNVKKGDEYIKFSLTGLVGVAA